MREDVAAQVCDDQFAKRYDEIVAEPEATARTATTGISARK